MDDQGEFGSSAAPGTEEQGIAGADSLPKPGAATGEDEDEGFAFALGGKPAGENDKVQQPGVPSRRMNQSISTRGGTFHVGVQEGKDGDEQQFIQFDSDVFSLMIVSEYTHRAFGYASGIFAFQITILSLIIYDLLYDESLTDDGNPFNVPINVEWQVWIAQIMAIVIAAVSQDDVRTSLKMISVGYDSGMKEEHPAASRIKFWLANFCRFSEGMLSLVVAFIFIVQSDNILDIFLNFAAVEFISNLDNLAFELASTGYLGEKMRQKTEAVEEIEFPISRPHFRWIGYGIFYLIIMTLLAGWSVVRARQDNGYLLSKTSCSTFVVEFGDEFFDLPQGVPVTLDGSFRQNRNDLGRLVLDRPPALVYSFFSGTYEAATDSSGNRFSRKNDRPVYYERGQEDPTSGRFYYCEDELAWVFSIPALAGNIPSKSKTSNCEWGWLAISPHTDAFRLEDVETFKWDVWTGGDLGTMENFAYECMECERDRDCTLMNGVCNNGECECGDGWGGFACQSELPYCESMVWSSFGDSSTYYQESEPLSLFRDGESQDARLVHSRPVYRSVSNITGSNLPCADNIVEILVFYSGRRWLYTEWCHEERKAVFDDNFHAFWDGILGLNTKRISSPTKGESPTDDDLEWTGILSSGGYGIFGVTRALSSSGFHCQAVDCERDNICGGSGYCQDSQCICREFFGGNFCEIDPEDSYCSTHYALLQDWMLDGFRTGFGATSVRFDVENPYYKRWWAPSVAELARTTIPIALELHVDNYPSETGFKVFATETGEILADFPPGSFELLDHFSRYSQILFLTPGTNYTFALFDTYGDGIIASDVLVPPITPSSPPPLVARLGDVPVYNLTALTNGGDVLFLSGDGDFGSGVERTFVVGTASTFPDPLAYVPGTIQVELFFDSFPHEIGYTLVVSQTGEVIASFPPGSFIGNKVEILQYNSRVFYLDPGQDYLFTIVDSYGDGLNVPGGFNISSIRPGGEQVLLVDGDPSFEHNATYTFMVPLENARDREL